MTPSDEQASVFALRGVAGHRFRLPDSEFMPGQTARITCASQDERLWVWKTLTGVSPPVKGNLIIRGRSLYRASAAERPALLREIGWVPQDGGLVSNLKTWENLILPVSYHKGTAAAELEEEVTRLFARLAVTGPALRALMSCLPDRLHPLEQRWIATVRAMLMRPDIIVYDAPFSGVERDHAQTLLRLITDFHRENPARVSVFLLPNEPFSERVPADVTYAVES
jgi:phospholipid/cholesterol/gamma-HCH transport system ATP-binding protein